jgi:hypothetical protein
LRIFIRWDFLHDVGTLLANSSVIGNSPPNRAAFQFIFELWAKGRELIRLTRPSRLYRLFYDGDKPQSPKLRVAKHETEWGAEGRQRDELRDFAKVLVRLNERKRQILLHMALRMVRTKRNRKAVAGCASGPYENLPHSVAAARRTRRMTGCHSEH